MENLDKVTVIGIAGGMGSWQDHGGEATGRGFAASFRGCGAIDSLINGTSEMTEEESVIVRSISHHPDAFYLNCWHQQLADLTAGGAIQQPTYTINEP